MVYCNHLNFYIPTGGPIDFCSRRVLCASSQSLADQLSKIIPEHIQLERD
jgi:hypothetical protein